MLFHTFSSQEERREFGGSDFFEIQFCKLPKNTDVRKITSTDSIRHWRDDSLYVGGDDENLFLEEYGDIFDRGIYNNLEIGSVDPYGINYYDAEQIERIIEKILEIRPADYEELIKWLNMAKQHNGFYILGV